MPTIKQLPLTNRVAPDDVVPISQNGVTRNVSVGTLLSSTQPAIVNPTNRLLGRTSLGAGGPEPIAVGPGLAITGGALAATGADHAAFPVATALSVKDDVVVTGPSGPRRLPVEMIRDLFTAGDNVNIDAAGRISAAAGAAAIGAKGDPGPVGPKGDAGPAGAPGPAGSGAGLPPPTPANIVATLQDSFLPAFLRPDGAVVYSTMDTFKAFLLGTVSPAPSVAITAVTFAPAAQVPTSSPAGTVLGTLGAIVSGGALANPAYSLISSAGGDVKLVGQQVQLNVNNLPAGTYTFRARVVADNAVAREDGLSFTIAVAGTGMPAPITGSGTGIDYDFGYGRAGTLAVPFGYKAATAMAVGEIVQFAQPSAVKDLPAGWRWYAVASDGTTRIDVQQDLEGTFRADGSLETAALTITNGTARVAGTTVNLTLKAEQVAPNRTPVITHTQVRSELANLKMEVTGYELGSDTFVMPAAWVLDNCKEWTATSPGWIATAGVAPVGGWRYLKRGPQCVDLQIWGYYRNMALTASHKWLRVDLLCQRLANGMWDIGAVQSQPNAFDAHPAGTLGAAKQARIACVARLKDGNTVLRTWGAAGDPNTVTRPLSAVDRATGRIDFGGGFADDAGGEGAVVGITGSDLPTGIVSGQMLGNIRWDGAGQVLSNKRNSPDLGNVTFGAGGSGSINFHPLCTTWPNGFAALYDADGTRIRWGGATRPTVLPMHDRGYLTQRAKVVPAMNLALPAIPLANQFKPKHILGSVVPFAFALQSTSNGEADDRLGYVTSTQAAVLWAPTDEARHRRAIVNSLGFMTFHIAAYDEAAGVEVIQSAGPLGDRVSTYPGAGASTWWWNNYVGGSGADMGNGNEIYSNPNPPARSPGHFYEAKWKQFGGGVATASGYSPQYDIMFEGSHAPNHHLVPWLRTADYAHLIALRAVACAANSGQRSYATINGKTERYLDGGGRTFAWPLAHMSSAEGQLPDGDPIKAMLFDLIDFTGAYFSDVATVSHPGRFIGQVFGKGASYMMAYAHMVVAQEVLKGKHPRYRKALENASIWSVKQYDDAQGPIPNGAYSFGLYGNDADNGGSYYPSLMAFKVARPDYGTLPFPSTGIADGFPALTYTARAEMCAIRLMAACHAMGLATIPSAKRVETQVLARQAAAGKTLAPGSDGSTYLYPQWDMVSLLPPLATVVPNVVTGIAASNILARTANISWTAPSTGGPVFTYRVEVKKGSAAYVTVAEDWDDPTINLTALLDNATNIVRITAKNPAGTSAASATASFTTPIEITGTITGPASAATVNTASTFAASASAYPVWACLYRAGADVGSRVQVTAAGNVSFTPTTTAAHTARIYTAQTGGVLVDDTPSFTPAPSQVSLYNFGWNTTETHNGQNPHNCTTNTSYKFACKVAKKTDGTRADNNPVFVICPTGTDPDLWPVKINAEFYQNSSDHVFYRDGAEQYLGAGTYDLWVLTADGERNKDPGGVYVRYES